jgi:hypothetical protein
MPTMPASTAPLQQRAEKPICFVISPIGEPKSETRDAADKALRHLIRKALSDEFTVERGDADTNPGAITPRILSAIQEADLIVADLTGLNANVFYELAIAHGYGIPTVHIQRASDKVPFDVKDMRVIKYDLSDPDKLEEAQKQLREYASFGLTHAADLETPLSQARRFEAVAQSSDPIAESNVQVVEALEDLSSDLKKVLKHVSSANSRAPQGAQESVADKEAIRVALSNARGRGALRLSDLDSTITRHTSFDHDGFIRAIAGKLPETVHMSEEDVNAVILDGEVLSQSEQFDPDPF